MQNDDAAPQNELESTTVAEDGAQVETPIQGHIWVVLNKLNFAGFSSKCGGRVEFQIAAVANFPKLNVTNDVQADSPSECARKCLEMVCR